MVERGFAIRWETAKTLMQNAGLKPNVKKNKKIIVEAIKTACFLNEECPQKGKSLSVNEIFFGDKGKQRVKQKDFVEWGRIGFVANKRTKTAKMENRGTAMMFVGYALDHPSGTYKFYNPTTDAIIESNSVRWSDFKPWEATNLEDAIGKLKTTPLGNMKEALKPSDEIEIESNTASETTNEVSTPSVPTLPTLPPPIQPARRITRSMAADDDTVKSNVYSEFNDATGQTYKVTGDTTAVPISDPEVGGTDDVEVSTIWTDDMIYSCQNIGGIDGICELVDMFLMHTCIQSDPGEPNSWKEALDGTEREWWLKSITAEFNNFIRRGGWEFVPLKRVTESGRRLVPTKLVFKKKDEIDGSVRFKARNVTLGFMMVPGVDFTERFSPVATDEALKTQLAINLKKYKQGWRTHSCDIEAAFLEPNMDNEMFIEPHPAMVECGFLTEAQRKVLGILLKKSMYGNVDAAIKFFKLLSKWMVESMGMKQSQADPCVFYKLDEKDELMLMVSVTVDDCAVTGLESDIDWFMTELQKRFKITNGGLLKKHLGVDYEWGIQSDGKAFCKATMDKKVKETVRKYEDYLGREAKVYESPGKPHEYLSKNEGEAIDIDEYRSLVGQLMFFTTKLGPKLGNATRALSGFMSSPGATHWAALGRVIGYLKSMEMKGILYIEPESFKVIALADTDFGNCIETRRSVGCCLLTIGGCLVDWSMSKHLTLSDSTTEAEYKELAKLAKGCKFLQMLLSELNLVDLPCMMFEDNAGAIFLAGNRQVSKRTKHIDLKHHLIREFTEDRNGMQQGAIFKIHTDFNTADIGTKNLDVKAFKRHAEELDLGMPMLRERVYGKNGILK